MDTRSLSGAPPAHTVPAAEKSITPEELAAIRAAAEPGPAGEIIVRLVDEIERLRRALQHIADLPDMSLFRPVKRMAQHALEGQPLETTNTGERE
ncbi:MAG: hypothetical protein HY332_07255 [Chloroflexi bacterium]|nr:hypothetical protein [Chloroflexota bacterium]